MNFPDGSPLKCFHYHVQVSTSSAPHAAAATKSTNPPLVSVFSQGLMILRAASDLYLFSAAGVCGENGTDYSRTIFRMHKHLRRMRTFVPLRGTCGSLGTRCKAPPKNELHAPAGQTLQRRIIKPSEKTDICMYDKPYVKCICW